MYCYMDWVLWAPLGAASLHILEEFIFPGGFVDWYKRYRADPSRITARFLILVNAALLAICCNAALLGRTPLGIAYWIAICALLCSERMLASLGHSQIWLLLTRRDHRRGDLSAVSDLRIYRISALGDCLLPTALTAGLVGSSYPIWSALYHRKRA